MRTKLTWAALVLVLSGACAQPERTAGTGADKSPAAASGTDVSSITATTSTDADLSVVEGALAQVDAELQSADESFKVNEEDVEQ